jgi:hypothetical protein
MVGILAGAEVGLTPFAALQSIAVIGNNPSLWGDGALALVQASGLLEDMEETDDGNTATCRLNRKERKTPIVRTFSMEDAKKAGLAGKAGPWTQYPARMRQMRARAFALRDGFSDVLKGLHIAEEVRDYAPMDGGTLENTAGRVTAAALLEQARDDTEDAGEGRDQSQMGETNTATADEDARVEQFLGFLATKVTVIDVNSLGADWKGEIAGWSDENRARAAEAQADRIAEIKAGK